MFEEIHSSLFMLILSRERHAESQNVSWGCFPCPTVWMLHNECIPLWVYEDTEKGPAVHCPLACWLCHRAGSSSQFSPLSGIIWCQILDGHLEEAEHQLEFLKEVQQSLGKSEVRALCRPGLLWDPAPATPLPSSHPWFPVEQPQRPWTSASPWPAGSA